MNYRNFKPNNINQNQINQNQMPMNFNAPGMPGGTPFNAMGNMQSRNGNKWAAITQFPQQQQRQFNNNNSGPMFPQNQGMQNNGPAGGPMFPNQNNCMPNRELGFNQEPFNRGGLMAPESGVRMFNRSPDRGPGLQLNRSPDRGAGLQMNRSPDRQLLQLFNRSPIRGPGPLFNRSPNRGPGPQFNRSPDRRMEFSFNQPDQGPGPLFNRSPDRGPGPPQFNQGPMFPSNCNSNMRPGIPELLSGYQFFNNERGPDFMPGPSNHSPGRMLDLQRRQLNRSPERGARGRRRSRSRSPERGPRRGGPPIRRDGSPRRHSRRESPPAHRRSRSPRPGKLVNNRVLPPMDERTVGDLPGSRKKWFKRYKEQGYSHEEALLMAKEPVQPAANYRRGPPQPRLPAVEPPMSFSNNQERKREHVRRDEEIDASSSMNEPSERGGGDPNNLKVCLLPAGYPKEHLSHQEKLDLEEAVLQEVLMAGSYAGAPLRFSSIQFKPGFLKMSCSNQATADWLMGTGPQLSSYIGRAIEPMSGNIKPPGQKISISVFLPRAAGKSDEYLLGLLKSQNQYNTDLWKIISRRDHGAGAIVVLGIDKGSAVDIAANNHSIFYRYGTVPVRGLKRKNAPPSSPKHAVRNPLNAKAMSLKKSGRGAKHNPSPSTSNRSPRASRNPSIVKSPSFAEEDPSNASPVGEADHLNDPEHSPLCIDLGSDEENP